VNFVGADKVRAADAMRYVPRLQRRAETRHFRCALQGKVSRLGKIAVRVATEDTDLLRSLRQISMEFSMPDSLTPTMRTGLTLAGR
jgi:hypothetical protein